MMTIPKHITLAPVDDDDKDLMLKRSVGILNKLRLATVHWNENGGYQNRENMNYWQNRADEFLNEINKPQITEQ